ncbi:MAG: molybdopterin cofactor-binding domain-containing protein [Pseudomonadota bacterium]
MTQLPSKSNASVETNLGGLGSPQRHDSAEKHVTGGAIYVDDIPEPHGLLHVQIGQSRVAHAEILALDLAAIRSHPGVVAVLTADDIPGHNDVSPIAGDDPLFADRLIEYWGQSLFAVAAETREAARAAAQKAVVTVRELPAICTIDDAMDAGSFLSEPETVTIGDPEAAIATAPHQIAGRLRMGGQEHFYLEGQAAMAVPGEDDDVTVYASSQHPSEIQHKVAHVLVITRR